MAGEGVPGMELRCEYCGNLLTGSEKTCPSCGAPVPFPETHRPGQDNSAYTGPTTIEGLQEFARARKLLLSQMRVFLGEDYKEPKAYGIFRESENAVVLYKNRADGSRVIHYRGPDEARAVRELYEKMHTMVKHQKAFRTSAGIAKSGRKGSGSIRRWFSDLPRIVKIGLVLLVVFFLVSFFFGKGKRRGYYHYNDNYYYQQNGSWYVYQGGDWAPSDVDEELYDNFGDYYSGSDYQGSYGIGNFFDSDYYEAPDHNYSSGGGWYSGDSDDDDDGWSWGGSSSDEDSSWDWDDSDDDDWDWGGSDDDDWDWGGGWDDISDWDSDW